MKKCAVLNFSKSEPCMLLLKVILISSLLEIIDKIAAFHALICIQSLGNCSTAVYFYYELYYTGGNLQCDCMVNDRVLCQHCALCSAFESNPVFTHK